MSSDSPCSLSSVLNSFCLSAGAEKVPECKGSLDIQAVEGKGSNLCPHGKTHTFKGVQRSSHHMCGAGQLLGAHRKSFIERVLENKSGEGKVEQFVL